MSDWKETLKELPPCDGTYWVANNIETDTHEKRLSYNPTIAEYDGYGFIIRGLSPSIYRPVTYWKFFKEIKRKYGKVDE